MQVVENSKDGQGIATGICLSDPNYKVVVPSAETGAYSQIQAEATIYPRSLTDSNVTCTLTPVLVKWRQNGYLEGENIQKKIIDISPNTPNKPGLDKELVAGTDYIVNPNTNVITEVAQYEIIFTGDNNYTGTKRLTWTIDRATREITIQNPEKRVYDGSAYAITAGEESSGFWYTITDTDNNVDVTDDPEEGSHLKITYVGDETKGTHYEESLTAPTDAGYYIVKISVDQTARYTEAVKEFKYTIYKKTVGLTWICEGNTASENAENPNELTYNGTKNIFHATVNNPVEGDTVNVTKVVYDGTTTGGKTYTASEIAPFEAGVSTVRATALDNPNYTLEGSPAHVEATPVHAYTVNKAPLWLTWEENNAVYVYDTTDHTPVSTIHGLCKNEAGTEDTCTVTTWSFTGTDVFGAGYTQTGSKAVNVSNGEVTITATGLSNPNYVLVQGEGSLSASFTIEPRDLSLLEVGTAEEPKEIWVKKISYSGKIGEPTIVWKVGELGDTLTKGTDYTASLSQAALEYNKNGLEIKIVGKGNYKGETTLPWNVDKLPCPIKVNNADDYANVTYGTALAAFDIGYVDQEKQNEDIAKNYTDAIENHLSFIYKGTLTNGESYESEETPTQSGEYEITVILEETDHYQEERTTIPYVIGRKQVTVSGIKALEKQYDGSAKAVLDFSESSWDGLLPDDVVTVEEELGKV